MQVEIEPSYHSCVEIEERRVHAVEHVLFHPNRASIVSITNQSLQEIDAHHGAVIGEASFDLLFLSSNSNGSSSGRLLEYLTPVGAHHIVGVFQSRCLVVWDLHDHVLQSVNEVEKQQKSIVAVAASLCTDKWLFYTSEGSNSIKVSSVDSKDPPKKISRKATNRSSQLTVLAYHTPRRLLCAGASDGALQLWNFVEENTLGGKEEAALVTPLFATQTATTTTQAPVVQLSFVASGTSDFLVVGYQNRVVEVWDISSLGIASSSQARPRDPYRIAVFHCLPPQAMDFAKKNGELSFLMHPQVPMLMVNWHAYYGAGSCGTAADLRVHVGGSTASTGTPAPVTLSQWHEFLPSAVPSSHDDGNAVVVYATHSLPPASPLMAYVSTSHHRQLIPFGVSSPQVVAIADETTKLALSTRFQLSVEQYFKYQDVPTGQLQVSRNAEACVGQIVAFQLQKYSLVSGEVEKLDDLPVWNNYQGRQLLPWKVCSNEQQSALCLQLSNPAKLTGPTGRSDDDASFSYVVVEVTAKRRGVIDAESEGGSGSGSANVSVTCGALQEALDVCFCDLRGDDAKQNRPYVLLVLASSGKSLGFQMTCDQVDQNTRVLLQRPVQRVFTTPISLSANSAYLAIVGSRLVYVISAPSGDRQTLVLSEDDLSLPRSVASDAFTTRANGERIQDVIWNTGAASVTPTVDDPTKMLAAVWTSQRIVIVSASLSVVAEYDLVHDLSGRPQSVLWMAQTLLYVTSDQQLRYVTPLRTTAKPQGSDYMATSQLLCSLPVDGTGLKTLQLASICGDRLCYTVTDPRSLECKTFMRPLAVCESLLLGFVEPTDARLKSIFERDFLSFVLSGGLETRCPVSDRLLEVMYHEFGWRDTVIKALDALMHPSRAPASDPSSSSTSGSSGGTYKKLSHLSPAVVTSLLLHAHKWSDAVRVFLSSDPALEEYALAEDGMGSTPAKLPSRTGLAALHLQQLAMVLASVGQAELAIKCLDAAGDDLGIVELLRAHAADPAALEPLLNALQKDWAKLNPPLAAATKVSLLPSPPAESPILKRQDLVSLLCCEQLFQTERRSRLLTSVRPFDKLNMPVHPPAPPKIKDASVTSAGRAGILYWKRLSPEDAKDTIGTSATPHFSTDEPKNPTNYSLFYGTNSGSSLALGGDATGSSSGDPAAGVDASGASNSAADASAKMTIGPFLEDEDAVVAYWRFEEGSSASDDDSVRTLDSMDTTKRENHLQILRFASLMTFATSTAPVDKGEDVKLQEAFSLRFPLASAVDVAVSTTDARENEWGAKCAVRVGSTLDIGFVFDDDPYRRKLTFEAWVRNVALFRKQQDAHQQKDDNDDGGNDAFTTTASSSSAFRDDASSGVRRLVCRRGLDKSLWWAFGLCDSGHLFLTFGSVTLKSENPIANGTATWQHVAFTVDITSPKSALLKLFLHASCIATKEITSLDANHKLVAASTKALAAAIPPSDSGVPPPPLSTMHLGYELTDYEMTEVRMWATARTADQLSDMKENYLGIAEAKRRMKIAIHQRNCQCEKCIGRRTNKSQVAKGSSLFGGGGAVGLGGALGLGGGSLAFPSTPPSSSAASSARDRRRPQPKS